VSSARLLTPAVLLMTALLTACGSAPKKARAPVRDADSNSPASSRGARPDQPGDYTAGGLYKPGVKDSGPAIPPDISHLKEPVPKAEPRSRYGNRTPYTVLGKAYHVMPSAAGYIERGTASWYGEKFHGRATSSLEPYDMYSFTAAHKTLPLPTYARVTNLDNGRSVIVRVNDRGPFHDGRLIDLSYAAAIKLGIHVRGTGNVEVRAITPGEKEPAAPVAVSTPTRRPGRAPTTTTPNPAPDGRTWLQVASFREKDNAQRFADRLQDADVDDVDIQKAEVRGSKVWRVRIGPFGRRELAERFAHRVRALGFGTPTLVAE
jgi:rare lipoprotein A